MEEQPSSSGIKLGWVTAQVLFARWSLMGYTENNTAGNNPPMTGFATVSSQDVPPMPTFVTVFRAAVFDYAQEERKVHSFLDLAARHWGSLEGLLGIGTAISICFP